MHNWTPTEFETSQKLTELQSVIVSAAMNYSTGQDDIGDIQFPIDEDLWFDSEEEITSLATITVSKKTNVSNAAYPIFESITYLAGSLRLQLSDGFKTMSLSKSGT